MSATKQDFFFFTKLAHSGIDKYEFNKLSIHHFLYSDCVCYDILLAELNACVEHFFFVSIASSNYLSLQCFFFFFNI